MTASKLIKPCSEYKDSFLEALALYHKEGRKQKLDITTLRNEFDVFVEERCKRRSMAYEEYPDWVELVPDSILWLVKNDEYIATVKVRHRLNWHLEKWGGHISLLVRPDKRLMGYGQKTLKKVKLVLNALDIERALLTVEPYNHIAKHIVEKMGAHKEDELAGTDKFPPQIRYWWDV